MEKSKITTKAEKGDWIQLSMAISVMPLCKVVSGYQSHDFGTIRMLMVRDRINKEK